MPRFVGDGDSGQRGGFYVPGWFGAPIGIIRGCAGACRRQPCGQHHMVSIPGDCSLYRWVEAVFSRERPHIHSSLIYTQDVFNSRLESPALLLSAGTNDDAKRCQAFLPAAKPH